MLRSSTRVDEATTKRAVWQWQTPPDPGMGVSIELARRHAGGQRDLRTGGEALAGIRGTAPAAPPGLDQGEPAGADGDEDLLDAGMGGAPRTDGAAGVARASIADALPVALWGVAVNRVEQIELAQGVACGRRLGEDRPIADAQRPVNPGLVEAAAVDHWRLAAVSIGRPAKGRREGAWGDRAELVD